MIRDDPTLDSSCYVFIFMQFKKNLFAIKVVEETFRQLLQKVCCVWPKQIYVSIDEGLDGGSGIHYSIKI